MNKHPSMREVRVVPRAMVPLANGEAARCGEADLALNVRQCEQSLQVTGSPAAVGAIAAGERLLLLTDGHRVTCSGAVVKIDGTAVATIAGTIVNVHAVGDLLVVVSEHGMTYIVRREGAWVVLDVADAIPQLSFTASAVSSSAEIAAYTFAEPYSTWRAPLASADCQVLAAALRMAWNALTADAAAEGLHSAPMLVRWGVRLVDDSYLWLSEPQRVGDITLGNADRVSAEVTTSSSRFTGIEASTMTLTHYRLDVDVVRPIDASWLPLVKSIDVLATDESHLLTSSRSLDYRCITRTTGGREYILEMGLSRRSASAIAAELAASPWHLIATAPAAPTPSSSDFVPPAVPLTMTNAQCGAVGALLRTDGVVCSTTAGGRLYCCTAGGDVIVTPPGNALVEAHRRSVTGTVPLAMAVVTKPLYSGGFGRYPVYVFTGDGVFAVPQSTMGTLGEARLVDRTIIMPGVAPVEGGGDVWFVSRHRHLCRLTGARVEVCRRDADCRALAWCNAYSELWMLPSEGLPEVRMASATLSRRSVVAVQLYSDPRHAVAVTAAGTLLDLEQEQVATMEVAWHSHPVALDPLRGRALHRVVWHVVSDGADLELRVIGQQGIMARECDASVITVNGAIDQPLAAPTVAMQPRTARLSLAGTATSGTLLLPCLLYS